MVLSLFILFFAIFTHGMTGLLLGSYIISQGANSILFVLAVWNIISAIILFQLHEENIANEDIIIDNNPKLIHIIINIVLTIIILIISQYYFHNAAIVTYSICICYSTSFGNIINNFLPKKGFNPSSL